MDRKDEDRLDEFEPIELGSVSEETKGLDAGSEESIAGEVNTRL
ncbi:MULTISPECIES: hypothetical protein [Hyphomonas]|nr:MULTISPECIES: hypothetical protein [Hyphomonas]|tara:strand:- start:1934 stop:2065 length:132 start_codon:yes stop_codon:yes gene_type:complete